MQVMPNLPTFSATGVQVSKLELKYNVARMLMWWLDPMCLTYVFYSIVMWPRII